MNTTDTEMQCCVISCDNSLDGLYWNNQYQSNQIGWDLGSVSPPIKNYINTLKNKDIAILIPGCGNSYEAEYLIEQGFTNITLIDIAPLLVENLKQKFQSNNHMKIILGDFFEHEGEYDLILEQTFFCALTPSLRQRYAHKMFQLLKHDGVLAGLLFNRIFEKDGPPFGGFKEEYEQLFHASFQDISMQECSNSIGPRLGTELWIEMKKNNLVYSKLLEIDGITCNSCSKEIQKNILKIENVLNVSISSHFKDILLVSKNNIDSSIIQETLAYEPKYKIVN